MDFLYIIFKVHKVPLKTRPTVLYNGNLLHHLGELITEWLQTLTKIQISYFQDSFTLKKELDQQKIPSNARVFICDATFMYTNIGTGPDLYCIGRFALDKEKHLTLPTAVLMKKIRLLMTNCVFQFIDTYFLQNMGPKRGNTLQNVIHDYIQCIGDHLGKGYISMRI